MKRRLAVLAALLMGCGGGGSAKVPDAAVITPDGAALADGAPLPDGSIVGGDGAVDDAQPLDGAVIDATLVDAARAVDGGTLISLPPKVTRVQANGTLPAQGSGHRLSMVIGQPLGRPFTGSGVRIEPGLAPQLNVR